MSSTIRKEEGIDMSCRARCGMELLNLVGRVSVPKSGVGEEP
jgi:hypothetical protein